MPKLGKEKFEITGAHHSGRTTYGKAVELYLWYDITNNYFYFDREELKKYLDEDYVVSAMDFRKCRTKEEAVSLMKFALEEKVEKKKYLQIKIGIPPRFWKHENPKLKENMWAEESIPNDGISKLLYNILESGQYYHNDHGLTMGFKRYIQLAGKEKVGYVECNEKWLYNPKDVYHHIREDNLMEWSEETEVFLLNVMRQLDELSLRVINFFNTDDWKALQERMQISNNKLLNDTKNITL